MRSVPTRKQYLALAKAARRFPRRPSPATLGRWILRGCLSASGQRVRLEAVRCGGRWMTTEDAIERFLAELTNVAPARQSAAGGRPPARRRASSEAAEELDRLGA